MRARDDDHLQPVRTKPAETLTGDAAQTPASTQAGPSIPRLSLAGGETDPTARSVSHARADAALAHSRDLVLFLGADGTIESASPACRPMFGLTPDDLVGRHPLDLVHPDDRQGVLDAHASMANLGDQARVSFRVVDPTGTVHWLEETATNLVDDPEVACVVVNITDVTERVDLLRRIEADRQALADAQAAAMLGTFELNLETGLMTRSDELLRMLGIEPGTELPDDFDPIHPDDRARVLGVVAETFAGHDHYDYTYRIVRPDGVVRWLWSQAIRHGGSNPNIVMGTALDITDRHEAQLAMAHQASHDWLTQLPNAASVHDRLQSAMTASGQHRPVAVLSLDVDRFKLVNDRVGHAGGDQVLQVVAARLRSGFPSTDLVARISGTEFTIVRTDVNALADAEELGERALALLSEPIVVGDVELGVTISVGVSVSTPDDSPASVLADVNDAMREAKRDPESCVIVYDISARARARRRRDIAAALPLALEQGELYLEYQPILDLGRLETVGFEALLRWEHPDLGAITPVELIPVAEASGLILPIGTFVLDRALRQLAGWRADRRAPAELWMAVNVSAQQLAQPRFADDVEEVLRRAGVPAAALHLEIAESVLMDRIDDTLPTIIDLRAIGVHVSIDDFGTGFSSLSYLSHLPVDTLKIDRSFIRRLGAAEHTTSIIRAMVTLAKTLGLAVIAEGVELPSQIDLLRELGCTHGQGFVWTRPLRPDAALDWAVEQAAMVDQRTWVASPSPLPVAPDAPDDLGRAIVEIAQSTGVRRRTAHDLDNVLRFDSLEIGLNRRRAWLAGRDLDLTSKEFELLAFMAEHTGQVFSRAELLHEVWQSSPEWQNPATVTEHIHRLRRSIETDPKRPRLITTVRGLGYRFGSDPGMITAAGRSGSKRPRS
jgi:diguanylate cyclase (GGDEF)-like protein/PAS domain S-box-containing protein